MSFLIQANSSAAQSSAKSDRHISPLSSPGAALSKGAGAEMIYLSYQDAKQSP